MNYQDMKAIIFESSDDLIEQLMQLHKDIDDDQEYFKGIYSESMNEIKKYHTDYPYLVHTKRFGCFIV
jgi:hypothetical protein